MEQIADIALKLLPGSAAGVATLLVGQPFDTIKVRLQTSASHPASFWAAATTCVKQEGVKGLYKGTSPQLLGCTIQHSVRYGSYRAAREQLNGHALSPTVAGLAAGAATGVAVSLIATPVELVKCRQQVSMAKNLSISEVVRSVLREQGAVGMMRGFRPTLMRSMLGNAAAFAAYETLVEEGVHVALAGGVAGLCFWTVSFPADVIKSHVQTGASWNRLGSNNLMGYFRGYSTVLLRAFPTNAAAFWTFSCCEGWISKHR